MGERSTVVLNAVTSVLLISSYWFAILSKRSPIYRLVREYSSSDAWRTDNDEEHANMRHSPRQFSEISAVLAGVTLATLAFVIQKETTLVQLIGGLLMIGASTLFFWAVGLHFVNTVSTRKTKLYTLKAAKFRTGFVLTSLGVFLFCNGLVWALSVYSIWFTIISSIVYGITLVAMIGLYSIRNDVE